MRKMIFIIYAIGLIVGKMPKVLGLRKVMNVYCYGMMMWYSDEIQHVHDV